VDQILNLYGKIKKFSLITTDITHTKLKLVKKELIRLSDEIEEGWIRSLIHNVILNTLLMTLL